jgi:hypothetical protein
MKFYHGGVKKLKIGDVILPYSVTGKRNIGKNVCADDIADGHCKPDKVYITTDLNSAKTFASSMPLGDVYAVEPNGSIEPDIDALGISFICDSAKVVSIVQRSVKFKTSRLLVMLNG